ncbi:hypothetical protein ACFFK0_23975 [Paenibacillus chartarius]|uniref:Uncharacterized protein n=1 Tax=Paenibacillus chartarius TaxID=747481 RepID=A0ABV6DS29_9BACL
MNGTIRWKRPVASHGGKMWGLLLGMDSTPFVLQAPVYKQYGSITDNFGYALAVKKDTSRSNLISGGISSIVTYLTSQAK